MDKASDYLYSWNVTNKQRIAKVKIEDDIRDALQNIRTVQPSLVERKSLLNLSAKVGIQYSFLGFPAASEKETDLVTALIEHIASEKLPIEPVLMARALEPDIQKIIEIQEKISFAVSADIFINTSALRLKIEGWTLDTVIDKIKKAYHFSANHNLKSRISLEDSARTAPDSVERLIKEIINLGIKTIVLCDTVGDCLPSGAAKATSFVMDIISKENANVEIGWHGHNDKGLSLANALAATEAGADIISGTFTGIGERTGNIPLEQVIYIVTQCGSKLYDLRYIKPLCDLLSSATKTEIPFNSPIIGKDAFSTSTGTHAAAIYKAKKFGQDFEDVLYSGVVASNLGRKQAILIGPNSGRTSIQAVLEEAQVTVTEEIITTILDYCKIQNRCLENSDELIIVLKHLNIQI